MNYCDTAGYWYHLRSVSFSTKVSKVSGSFACTTTVAKVDSKTKVVEAVADISVKALTADIIGRY